MELKDLGLQKLKLNINDNIIETVFAKEGDHKSRGLDIQVLKNNVVTDTTGVEVEFYAKPKDGEVYLVLAKEKDLKRGKYEIIYPTHILQPGPVKVEIKLVKGEQVISTKKFILEVENAISTDDIVEKSDDRPLLAILVEVAKNEKARIEAENIRVKNEKTRVENEEERIHFEEYRESAEEERISNEDSRSVAESQRQDNEEVRQVQEQHRQNSMTEIENRFNLLETSKQQDAEVINARTSTVKNKTFDSLNDRLEDTEKEIDKPLYSTPVETYNNIISLPNNTTNGQIGGSIKGDTIVNHAGLSGKGFNSPQDEIITNQGTLKGGVLELVSDGQNYKNFRISADLKEGTTYTYMVEVVENTLNVNFALLQSNNGGSVAYLEPKKTGLIKFTFEAGKEDKQARLNMITLYLSPFNTVGTKLRLKNFMILEGDYTNRPINYTEGTKSIPASFKIKSVGKNLFDKRKAKLNKNIGGVSGAEISGNGYFISDYIKVEELQKYTRSRSNDAQERTSFYDENKKTIQISSDYAPSLISTPANTRYIRISGKNGDIDNYIISKGTQATEYEPYKESTSYVVAKDKDNKIVNLRSLPNGTKDKIDLDKRQCMLNTNKITLNGSENWIDFTITDGIPRASIRNWVTDNNSVYFDDIINRDSAIAYNDSTTITIDLRNNIPLSIGSHGYRERLELRLSSDITTLEEFKQYLQNKPITLIYQLAEPEILPLDIKLVQAYENGTIIIEPYIKDKFTVDSSLKINLQYPIKAIDKLLKLNTETAKWEEIEGELSEDGQVVTVTEEGIYEVYGEIKEGYSTEGLKRIVTNINLNAQINSNTTAIEKINNKIYTDADLFTAMLLQQEVRITALEGGMTV